MSWFVNVFSATLLYGVPALLGTSISYFFVRLTNPPPSDSSSRSVFSSLSVDWLNWGWCSGRQRHCDHRIGAKLLGSLVLLHCHVSRADYLVHDSLHDVPFNAMHKKLFIIHSENVSSRFLILTLWWSRSHSDHVERRYLHLSAADGDPGFHKLVKDIAPKSVKTDEKRVSIVMDDDNPGQCMWSTVWEWHYLNDYSVQVHYPSNLAMFGLGPTSFP